MSVTTRHAARACWHRAPPARGPIRSTKRPPAPDHDAEHDAGHGPSTTRTTTRPRPARPAGTPRPTTGPRPARPRGPRPARPRGPRPARRSGPRPGPVPPPSRPPPETHRLRTSTRPPVIAAPIVGLGDHRFERRVRLIRLVLVMAMLLGGRPADGRPGVRSGSLPDGRATSSRRPGQRASLRGGIYARDGVATRAFRTHRRRDRRRLPDGASRCRRPGPLAAAGRARPRRWPPSSTGSTGYVVLARQLSQSERPEDREPTPSPGITLVADSKRVVPNGNLASPSSGSTNAAGRRRGGNRVRRQPAAGGNGGQGDASSSRPSGVALPAVAGDRSRWPASPGTGLELTLDYPAPVRVGAGAGQGDRDVARPQRDGRSSMDVKTGPDPLHGQSGRRPTPTHRCSATPPTAASTAGGVIPIGPNDAVNEAPNNLAVTQLYEPGSVFKLVTFSAALQDGLINPNSVFTVPDQINLDGSHLPRRRAAPDRAARPPPRSWPSPRTSGPRRSPRGWVSSACWPRSSNLGLRQVHRPRLPRGVARAAGHGRPVGADRLRVAAHRAGGRRQRTAGPRRLQRGGQRRHLRPARSWCEATVGPSGAVTQTAPSPTHRVFSPPVDAELTTMLEQVVSTGTGTSAVVPGLHRGGKDRHGADPHPRAGLLRRRRLHGLVRGVRPGTEPDPLDDRRPRPPDADLRRDGGGPRVLPDHELRAAPLRHSDHPGCGHGAPARRAAQSATQPGAGHHVTRYHRRADWRRVADLPCRAPLSAATVHEPCR